MPSVKICSRPAEVSERLAQFGLTRGELVEIVLKAVAAKNDSVDNDPANAPGSLAYIYGTRAIRDCLRPKGWEIDRTENIEATLNPVTGVRLVYQNCDICCDPRREPRAISGKGAGASRMVESCNGDLFPELLEQAQRAAGPALFLCVSTDGEAVRAELSCPTKLEGKQFGDFAERILLIQKDDLDPRPTRSDAALEEEERDDYPVVVTKK